MSVKNFFKKISEKFQFDLGIDLGTANIVVINTKFEILYNEPTVVCIDKKTKKIIAVGDKANSMYGKTPDDILAIKPLKDGVIQYFDITHQMLKHILQSIFGNGFFIHPRVVIGVPSQISDVEKRAVVEASQLASARETLVVEESLAAAVGMGIDITQPEGHLVVDIGGGTTEVSVISLGGIVKGNTIRVASEAMDNAIINYVKKEKDLIIGSKTAEMIKINVADVSQKKFVDTNILIKGRHSLSGLPQEIELLSSDIKPIIEDILNNIVDCIKLTLEETPPELSGDVYDKGIVLTGGGALLKGLSEYISEKIMLPVIVSSQPLLDVSHGTLKLLKSNLLK
jgi:rod shape-determining protein MreB and related proteins